MAAKTCAIGKIVWHDLTVAKANGIRDFYRKVVGWTPGAVRMGRYSDWAMRTPAGATVAGVCNARGVNAKLPPQWLMYVRVEDVDAAAEKCVKLGGKIIDGPRAMGAHRFCCIEDPAGAVLALIA